jgi:hypothetical protein
MTDGAKVRLPDSGIRKKLLHFAVLTFVVGAIGGCASVPMTSPGMDAAAKGFPAPSPGASAIYIYRQNGAVGGALAFSVTLGQRSLGQLGPGTFFLVEVTPGTHELRCVGSENSEAASVTLAPGELRYVELSVRFGVGIGRCSVAEVNGTRPRCRLARPARPRRAVGILISA